MIVLTLLMAVVGVLLVATGVAGALLAMFFGAGGLFDSYRRNTAGIVVSAVVALTGVALIVAAAVLR